MAELFDRDLCNKDGVDLGGLGEAGLNTGGGLHKLE